MNYLVTGGAGFIGSHLVEELLNRGHAVTVIDNLLTGERARVHNDATFHEADIVNADDIRDLFHGIDGVFHTAAYARVPRSIKEPARSHYINTDGTFNVLEACVRAGVKKMVFSSSSTVYGEQETLPLHEDMKPNPMCPYAAQKAAAEHYCSVYAQLYGLETVSLRYFSVYGKHMKMDDEFAMAMPAFISARLRNEEVTIYGDGTVTRDFTHVDDIVRGNILAMESDVKRGEVINLGAGNNITINRLAEMIGVKTRYAPARYEPKDTLADTARAQELLGWRATVSFAEGARDVIDHYLTHAKTPHYEPLREIA